jgi:hypothetical protein
VTRTAAGLSKAGALIVTLLLAGLPTVGFPAALFALALFGGVALWAATTLRTPVDPAKVIVPYLITVAIFVVHVLEEYLTHVDRLLAAISGHAVSEPAFLVVAAFFAPTLWLAGAVLLLERSQLGDYIASTFYFGMIVGESSHFAFPFLESGRLHYASGMITAVPLIASAALALRRTIVEVRRQRAVG